VSVRAVDTLRLPEIAVMVSVTVPVAAVALAVKVRVLSVVAGFVLNAAVTPAGRPDVESVTCPLNPLAGVTVIALVTLLPCVTVRLAGLAESV
jgi:hypothetical protein